MSDSLLLLHGQPPSPNLVLGQAVARARIFIEGSRNRGDVRLSLGF